MKRRQFLLAAASTCLVPPALAYGAVFYSVDGLALGGFDPVSYFTKTGPLRGRRDIAVLWKGGVWQFAHPAHLAIFESDPWRFAPRYGGHCAYAMSRGKLIGGDPQAWRVTDERLYVTANMKIREVWLQDSEAYIARANGYWPQILQTK